MKKSNKIIALCLSFVLLFAAVGGTIAWLTDKDSKDNVFTIGSVDVDIIESQIHRQNPESGPLHTDDVDLTESQESNKYATSDYVKDEAILKDAENYATYLAQNGTNMVPGRIVKKMAYVKNTGKNDAYVRIRILVPSAANNDFVAVADGGIITNMWTAFATGYHGENKQEFVCAPEDADYVPEGTNRYTYPVITKEGATIDGIKYDVYTYTRIEPLAPGEMTYWNAWGYIGMSKDADEDSIQKAFVAGAFNVDGELNVLVQADAIQAEGFADYTAAWTAFDAKNN